MTTQSGGYTLAPSHDEEVFRAWDTFRHVGAPITPRLKAMLSPHSFAQTESISAGLGGSRMSPGDPYVAYRDQPTTLSALNLGAPIAPGGPSRGANLPVDANGMVTVFRPGRSNAQQGTEMVLTKVPWQQVTQDDMAMLQGQRGGSSAAGGM